MNRITVSTSHSYDVLIGNGLLKNLGRYLEEFPKCTKVAIISDSNVWPNYCNTVEASLNSSAIPYCSYIIPAGEESKNGHTYLAIVNFLAENHLTRTDLLIALGGGVVGDLTGFAAATYLRGIRFLQIPTTLLAAVDSSVGGKTAIDLPAGKNLCGAFCQPSLVLCDTDTLTSLPDDIFRDGCAEVIKYGILYDPALFSQLEQDGLAFDRKSVIARCVELKRDVVMEDEFDTGSRMKLNLGHTIGHGIEARSNFTLSHGKSVAIGMAIVARANRCPDTHRILTCLEQFGLPTKVAYPVEDIYQFTLSDKKRAGGHISLILPEKIGLCHIVPTPVENLKTFIEEGM